MIKRISLFQGGDRFAVVVSERRRRPIPPDGFPIHVGKSFLGDVTDTTMENFRQDYVFVKEE